MFARFTMLVLAAFLLLGGCAGQQTQEAGAFADSLNRPYLLGSGVKVRITVIGQDNLSRSYTVDGGGAVAMPLIGPVKAQGKTLRQLEGTVRTRLADGYLRHPNVTVEIETHRPFFILGEVRNPGQYPFVSGMTVQTAVAIAGGYTPRARQEPVTVTRQVEGRIIQGRVPAGHPVRPGDTINVSERLF
jgi:polysaccharide export outer membrane protein